MSKMSSKELASPLALAATGSFPFENPQPVTKPISSSERLSCEGEERGEQPNPTKKMKLRELG